MDETVNSSPGDAMAATIRATIRGIVETEPFGLAELNRLERFLGPAAEALRAVQEDTTRTALRKYTGGSGILQFGAPTNPDLDVGTENYGVKMQRELIEGIRSMMGQSKAPSAPQLIQAIGEARDAGMSDVAAALTHQLREKLGLLESAELAPLEDENAL